MWTFRSIPNRGNHLKILRGWSQRRRFFHHALTGSPDHNSCVQFLRLTTFTLRDAGKKCRGSTGFLLGTLAGTTLPATTETFGANRKYGAKMHQCSGKTHWGTARSRQQENGFAEN